MMQDSKSEFRAALLRGDYDWAERIGKEEREKTREVSLWNNELGTLYLAQGRMDEALEHFDKAAVMDERNVEAFLNGLLILSDLGFYDEALARFEELSRRSFELPLLTQISANLARVHVDAAEACRVEMAFDAALDLARKSLTLQPTPFAKKSILHTLLQSGRYADVLREIEKHEEEPDSEMGALKAQCLIGLGKLDEARSLVRKAENEFPPSHMWDALRECLS